MKHIEMCLRLLVVLAIITTSCSGGSEAADPLPSAVPPTEVPFAATAVPTATPLPEIVVSDGDRIDAALGALEAAPGGDMIAYDVLDTSINGENVTITVCGWTGDTVFDSIYEAIYATTADAAGTVSAAEISTARGAGECLNTTLIETAIDTINRYEEYWGEAVGDPESFISDPRRAEVLTPIRQASADELLKSLVEDDVYFDHVGYEILPESAVADVLWRESDGAHGESIELAFCRDMDPAYGVYRDGVLITDESLPDDPRLHAVNAYVLIASDEDAGRLLIAESDSLVWSDCFFTGDWPDAASGWRGHPTPYLVLAS